MNESQWDEKVRSFLKKTTDELKRAGNDVKVEAEKLMREVKDPARQEKLKKGLETVQLWARKTAEEVAHVVETGVKKAEGAVRGAVDTQPDAQAAAQAPAAPAAEAPPAEPLRHDTPVDMPAVTAAEPEAEEAAEPAAPKKKTIGTGKKKPAAKKAGGSKKPLGKKRGT
ncbi:MAG: hypothetical protein JNK82_08210 [Myxococcaceae bacterium]|nr:hypothetical protein [Myxococcaceae bacterium]